jgi:Trypsin-like peptidase domain
MKPLRTCLTVLTVLTLPAFGLAPRAHAEDIDVETLYKKVVKSCVFIVTPAKGGYGMGSGSLIDADKRLVLTNWHVVDEEDTVFVQFPVFLKDGSIMTDKQEYIKRIPAGQAIKGKVLYRDKTRDLALVQLERIPSGTKAIPLAKKSIGVGATTWNIGNPGAVKQVFGITEGKVRAVGIEKFLVGGGTPDSVFEIRARMVTTTNPTNPGDSGGPLFDKRGYQVAVTQSGSTRAQQVNSFVDVTEVRGFLNEKKMRINELSDEPDPKTPPPPDPKADPKVDPKVVPEPGNGAVKPPPMVEAPPTASPADEKTAEAMLKRAKLFAEGEDNRPTFIAKLNEIIKKYPATTAGKEAKKLLTALK